MCVYMDDDARSVLVCVWTTDGPDVCIPHVMAFFVVAESHRVNFMQVIKNF